MQKITASILVSTWLFLKRTLRSWMMNSVISGRSMLCASISPLAEEAFDVGVRTEIRSGDLTAGAIWEARSVPEAEFPTMITFYGN